MAIMTALAFYIFEHPDQLALFDEATLLYAANGLPQSYRETMEINKNM